MSDAPVLDPGKRGLAIMRPGEAPATMKLYDFRRPDKFSREQIRTIEAIGENFARAAGPSLSAALRVSCEIVPDLVDQMTYDEFMSPLSAPCTLAVLSMKPLKGPAVMHLDARATDALVESMLGGTPAVDAAPSPDAPSPDAPPTARAVSDIERGPYLSALGHLAADFGAAWSWIEGMKAEVGGLESEARYCQIVPPTEMIVLMSFSLSVGGAKGRLDVVLPFLTIEPIVHQLSAKFWYSSRNPVGEAAAAGRARRLRVPADVMCDVPALSVDSLRALRKGSVIAVPDYGEGRAWLRLGGARVAELSGLRIEGGIARAGFEGASAAAAGEAAAVDPVAALAADMRNGLAALKEGVSEAMASVASRMDELKGGQEDLSDRVPFGQADAASASHARPFASLAGAHAESLALFLADERPQLVALVLSFLDDALGARLLALLPEGGQADVARRVVTMRWVSPDALADIEKSLGRRLSSMDRSRLEAGGVQKMAGILNYAPRATERLVIESLDAAAPDIAEALKRSMFVFEDIIMLDDESIAALFETVDERDLVVAMKAVAEGERERIFARFPADRRERLALALAGLGRVRLSDCDAAGFRVVDIIRRLEREGRIGILRQGE